MSSADQFHLHISRRAMATDFEVLLPHSLEAAQIDEAVRAMEMLDQIEAALTVYQPHSEISRLNREAARGPIRVSAMVLDILQQAVRLSALTDGAFDVTAGLLVDAWGFTTRSGRRPSDEQIRAAREHVGWRHLEIDPVASTVRFGLPEMRLNLGAIGKGYALDRVARSMRAAGINDFLLHGGNSSLITAGRADSGDPVADQGRPLQQGPRRLEQPAAGSELEPEAELTADGGLAKTGGWWVGLRHPTRPHLRAGGIVMQDLALATSGSGKQHFHHQGRRYGHVIDPRTGYPAGELLSLSVLAAEATDADAIATGLFVESRDQIERYAAEHPEHGIIAIGAGEREGATRTELWNVPEGIWTELSEER